MRIFKKLFGGKEQDKKSREQSVLVHLDGANLPDEVYEEYDLSTLEDQLIELIAKGKLGELDGNEFGPGVTTLFMYGPDAERLFSGIEAALRAYPLCKGAKVVIRRGPHGSEEREVTL